MKHGDLTVESSRRLNRRPAKSLGAENRSGICGGWTNVRSGMELRPHCQLGLFARSMVRRRRSVGRSVGRGGSADDDAGAAAAAARNK